MRWSEEMREGIVVASPQGRVDESTAQAFTDALAGSVDQAGKAPSQTLTLDLSAIDYVSSRGLRALTLAKRRAEGVGVTIILAAPNETMREILAISRYDKLFTVVDTL